jgi:hypothetical protein
MVGSALEWHRGAASQEYCTYRHTLNPKRAHLSVIEDAVKGASPAGLDDGRRHQAERNLMWRTSNIQLARSTPSRFAPTRKRPASRRIVMGRRSVELKVEHYRHQLALERFWARRRRLIRLLAVEEAKLQALDERLKVKRRKPVKHSPLTLSD